jgi:hypothetical protein
VAEVQQFLRIFLDIVLWRRGPQDLPASSLLLAISVAAYIAVSALQLVLLGESTATWLFFLVGDPLLLAAWVWLLLKLYGHPERYVQTAAAIFGTGALLGLGLYLPLQMLMPAAGEGAAPGLAQLFAVLVLASFALVTGRILKLATDSNLFTGIAVALTYFMVVNLVVGLLRGTGS